MVDQGSALGKNTKGAEKVRGWNLCRETSLTISESKNSMNPSEVNIVFMGTPEFAVPSLQILHEAGFNIVGVITAPDRKGGRGMKKTISSAIKKYAIAHNLPVLQPTNLKNTAFIETLRDLQADLQMVVAFRMLPEVVWSMPRLGTINLHGSLLPAYRGAAPINWAIINGEKQTGLTTFFIQKEIDTGHILLTSEVDITPDDTAGDLHDRMMVAGAKLVLDTVKGVVTQAIIPRQQDHSKATKAPKIFHETCNIDFARPLDEVYNFIRGLSPYPGAWTLLDGKEIKLLEVSPLKEGDLRPAQISTDQKSYLHIGTNAGKISVRKLKMEGKRALPVAAFLNGYQIKKLEVKNLKKPLS